MGLEWRMVIRHFLRDAYTNRQKTSYQSLESSSLLIMGCQSTGWKKTKMREWGQLKTYKQPLWKRQVDRNMLFFTGLVLLPPSSPLPTITMACPSWSNRSPETAYCYVSQWRKKNTPEARQTSAIWWTGSGSRNTCWKKSSRSGILVHLVVFHNLPD